MPRITNQEYLDRHYALQHLWDEHQGAFLCLRPTQQMVLHSFYRTTNRGTDKDLIEFRQKITKAWPSMPHEAGKAFAKLAHNARPQSEEPGPTTAPVPTTPGWRRVTVRGLVRPDSGVEQIAKILLELYQTP